MGMRIKAVSVLVVVMFIISCSAGSPARKPGTNQGKDRGSSQSSGPGAAGKQGAAVEREARENLPWQNDSEFIRARTKNNTPVLMASYKATLPDPILYERHNISRAADLLSGAVVKPGAVFSLNGRIGWRSAQRGFKPGPMYSGGRIVSTVGGGVCKIASVIYNAAILADQEIIERYPHSMTVPYVPPGQDATISYGTKDFKFRNKTGSPILIWAKNTGGTLYIAFYGTVKPPRVRWIHKTLRESDTRTEYVNDPTLPQGAERVIFEGSKGITVHSWVVISSQDGREVTKDLGIDTYDPSPRVIAVRK